MGKRVDHGIRYLPDDRFYVDFVTDNPFANLEQYGLGIKLAQNVKLNLYDFPTVCLWYANFHSGGIKGLMFDYPARGWASGGGMEDKYATTARAYRDIFRLAREGLGEDCYLHERNMELRPGEVRMMSIHQVSAHPQFIATNRHIMQGYLDLTDTEWLPEQHILQGVSQVVGADPYLILVFGLVK